MTVKVALFRVLVIVQQAVPPLLMATASSCRDWRCSRPAPVSVAVQVEPATLKPVTVVEKAVAGDALPEAGAGVPPLVQVTETGTLAVGPAGE